MDKLKYIKLENEDGSYSDSIPLAVDSDHVDVNGSTLTEELGNKATKVETSNLLTEINVQKSRIDNLVELEDGSTTGDAELTDIRIGYDGITDPTAGDSVRRQVNHIVNNLGIEKIDITDISETGVCYANTNNARRTDWSQAGTMDYVLIDRAYNYYYTGTVLYYAGGVNFYDINKTFLSSQFGVPSQTYGRYSNALVNIPENAYYMRPSWYSLNETYSFIKEKNIENTIQKIDDEVDEISEKTSDIVNETIDSVTEGYFIQTNNGNERTLSNFPNACMQNDYIKVKDTAIYTYCGDIYNYAGGVIGYDANKQFVTAVCHAPDHSTGNIHVPYTNIVLDIPPTVKYIRCSTADTTKNTFSLTEAISIKDNTIENSKQINNIINENTDVKNVKMNYIYVSTEGSDVTGDGTEENPYASIFYANSIINDNNEYNRYTIKVANGIYDDLQERYAGSQVTGLQGILCKNYVYYEGNVERPDLVKILWDGAYGYDTSSYVYSNMGFLKCPFHVLNKTSSHGGYVTIKGFTIEAKNTRYALHVETSGYGKDVEWHIEDCIFIWHGTPDCSDRDTSPSTIGTGSGNFEKGFLTRCKIVNDAGITNGFMNHDGDNVYGNKYAVHEGANITIESCVFNGGEAGRTSIVVRNLWGDNLLDGYNRINVLNSVGINQLWYRIEGQATVSDWRAKVECSDIVENRFLTNGLMQ